MLEQRVLGIGGVQGSEGREPSRAGERLALQSDELLRVGALDPGFHEMPERGPKDVERLGHLCRRAACRRRRVVQLVREAGRHRAERCETLAALLDGGDAADHGGDLEHHATVHLGLGEREAPEVLGRDERDPAWRLGEASAPPSDPP